VWDDPSNLFSLAPLRRQIDRLFEDFNDPTPGWLSRTGSFGFWPTSEVHETDKAITIRMELPGVDGKDLSIGATEDAISISGEKKSETETGNGDLYRSERSFGAFTRTFSLPRGFDSGKVDARFENGVLSISIPKPVDIQPHTRQIPIH
jgi:HSP20 family protein